MSKGALFAAATAAAMTNAKDLKLAEEGRIHHGTCPTAGRLVGPADPRKKQPRNKPCGCGSGVKSKKCCGDYPEIDE